MTVLVVLRAGTVQGSVIVIIVIFSVSVITAIYAFFPGGQTDGKHNTCHCPRGAGA